jgi:hypothetical protein
MKFDIGDFVFIAISIYGYLKHRVPQSFDDKENKRHAYMRKIF